MKIVFPFFESFRGALLGISLQSLEKMLIWTKNIFLRKFNMGTENVELFAEFESVEKVINKFIVP